MPLDEEMYETMKLFHISFPPRKQKKGLAGSSLRCCKLAILWGTPHRLHVWKSSGRNLQLDARQQVGLGSFILKN